MSDRFTILGVVSILIIKDNKILLLRRANTGWKDGEYNIPGGHLEPNETFIDAARREAKEEAGVEIKPMDLHLVHVSHRKTDRVDGNDYLELFFRAYAWHGEPRLTEEDKSDDLIWAELNDLPENTVSSDRDAIKQIEDHEIYSQFGWKND